MTVSYSVSNTVNYDLVGIGFENPDTSFPSIYGNFPFGYTVTFSSTDGVVTGLSVISSPASAPATVLSPNSVRIARNPAVELFLNERYNFSTILPPSVKVLDSYLPAQVASAGTETSIYDWDTPPIEEVTNSYIFAVRSFDPDPLTNINNISISVTSTFTQKLVWSQFPGLVILNELVARSRW